VIDGGNIVRWNDAAIMTDKIFKEHQRECEPAQLSRYARRLCR